jgi:hypothetical protein
MTTDQILILHRASPFRPFVLFLSDTRSLEIPNVECFGLAEDASSFMLFQPPDVIEIIDPTHVVSGSSTSQHPLEDEFILLH